MCFSASASFTAGTLLLAMGGVAVHRVRWRRALAYALIPALFGVQQLLEGGLWLSLADPLQRCGPLLTHAFSAFSQVIWPVYIPVAVVLLEPHPLRCKALLGSVAAGVVVSLFLLLELTHLQIRSQAQGGHIAYIFPHFHKAIATGLYLLGACISPLLSSHRAVRWFGVLITFSLVMTIAFYSLWFISVWCFFAALTSAAVLAFSAPDRDTSEPQWR
jgi:hypothetical protein